LVHFQIVRSYPEINISKEIFNSHISRQEHLILPVNETIYKRILQLYFDEGLTSALNELASLGATIASPLCRGILSIINIGQRMRMFLNPYLKEISLEKYSQVRNYETAAIRFLAYNQICFKLAIAGIDDSIRIYNNDSLVTLLKHAAQKSILTIAWRKFSSSCIVVGCCNGFLIWAIDPNSNITRPLSQAQHYRFENHFPVTSAVWNQNGKLLLTSSISDNSILIWDIDKGVSAVPLKRTSIPYLNLQYSLDGAFLFR
jgi:aladin